MGKKSMVWMWVAHWAGRMAVQWAAWTAGWRVAMSVALMAERTAEPWGGLKAHGLAATTAAMTAGLKE
jgi:hypothetical protein